jgi:excisionase family DNA binding protein
VPETSPWLTVAETATIAKCGKKTIYKEITAGRLRAARIGGRRDLRIHRDWIDQWLERSATPIIVNRGAA